MVLRMFSQTQITYDAILILDGSPKEIHERLDYVKKLINERQIKSNRIVLLLTTNQPSSDDLLLLFKLKTLINELKIEVITAENNPTTKDALTHFLQQQIEIDKAANNIDYPLFKAMHQLSKTNKVLIITSDTSIQIHSNLAKEVFTQFNQYLLHVIYPKAELEETFLDKKDGVQTNEGVQEETNTHPKTTSSWKSTALKIGFFAAAAAAGLFFIKRTSDGSANTHTNSPSSRKN